MKKSRGMKEWLTVSPVVVATGLVLAEAGLFGAKAIAAAAVLRAIAEALRPATSEL
nr:MAG: hypothetical protein [Microvirus sp.]